MIDRIRYWAFAFFLALIPLSYYSGGLQLRDSQEHLFQYGGFCLLGLFCGNIWLGLFLILNVALYVYAGADVGSMQVINVAIGCILFMISRRFFSREDFLKFTRVLYIVLVLDLIWMVFQKFGIDPIFSCQDASMKPFDGPMRLTIGFFGILMANAIFLSIMWCLLASVSFWLSFIILIPILQCHAVGVLGALCLAILFYVFYLHRKLFIPFILVMVTLTTGFFFYLNHDDPLTMRSRFGMWHEALWFSFRQPLGYGPDSFRNTNKLKNFLIVGDNDYNPAYLLNAGTKQEELRFYSASSDSTVVTKMSKEFIEEANRLKQIRISYWDNAHNQYLTLLFEYGFFGVFLFFGLLRECIIRFRQTMKSKELIVITSCLIVYLGASLTHFPLEMARLAYFFPILLGAFFARTDQ